MCGGGCPDPLRVAAFGSALKTTFFIFYANKHAALNLCLLWDGEAFAPPPALPLGVSPPPPCSWSHILFNLHKSTFWVLGLLLPTLSTFPAFLSSKNSQRSVPMTTSI